MLADSLKKYKELYSEFLQEMVNFHNIQEIYFKQYARDTGFALRKSSKKISKLHKELRELSLKISKERRVERRAEKLRKKESYDRLKNLKSYNPKLKDKNNGHNNTTTTKTI